MAEKPRTEVMPFEIQLQGRGKHAFLLGLKAETVACPDLQGVYQRENRGIIGIH